MLGAWGSSWGATSSGTGGGVIINDGVYVEVVSEYVNVLLSEPSVQIELAMSPITVEIVE